MAPGHGAFTAMGGSCALAATWRSWWKLRKGRVALPPGVDADEAVSGITWYSAHAYAEWLSATTGALPPPTWFEWLKAMCGADSRLFASGNDCTATPTHEESPYDCATQHGDVLGRRGVEGNPHQEVVAGVVPSKRATSISPCATALPIAQVAATWWVSAWCKYYNHQSPEA